MIEKLTFRKTMINFYIDLEEMVKEEGDENIDYRV